jgi:hypothetical protein
MVANLLLSGDQSRSFAENIIFQLIGAAWRPQEYHYLYFF